ncbi:MAG TPA: VOC family protein [Candidatus Binataceae bacterium]|nr:VOC family protein [Candidatus Binataceae bacterium]
MGGFDHLMVNCNRYKEAVQFYAWLMPEIGFTNTVNFDDPAPVTGFFSDANSFWVCTAEPAAGGQAFDKRRAGVREIAFRADSRAQIDKLAKEIVGHGGTILDAPREYDYRPGYYSVFFADPDGIKLELVHY